MPHVERLPNLNFLSELYVNDAPDAWLLAEYPSSNSSETRFQNRNKFIIHDPFPPPRRELIKFLGPHHLMCCWGNSIDVTSEIAPPAGLVDHWSRSFGEESLPVWRPHDDDQRFITLFPHESLTEEQQVVPPDVNYALHSKEVIEKIDCPQADVLSELKPPCIAKLSHGYAGLGNFMIRSAVDADSMQVEIAKHWPDAVLVSNSIIDNIVDDFGVQFYLRRDGSIVWLGFTEQLFDENKKWCGGTFSAPRQSEMFEDLCELIVPTAKHLHENQYFGLVGIDILRDRDNQMFLVDVNPRLTGISPFLMASRIFARDEGLEEGIYQASCQFKGTADQLFSVAESFEDAKVVVQSVFEESNTKDESEFEAKTICHLSVSSKSQARNQEVLNSILG
jgi:hypothetical protein